MSLPFTSVVSYHTNPMTCGVAKFSSELARRLGVKWSSLDGWWGDHPLLSLKWSEFDHDSIADLYSSLAVNGAYSLFWHDKGDQRVIGNLTDKATHVFYADPSLGSPGLWCPSLITPRKRPVRLFSFGMAHKLQTDKYKRVRELLDAAGQPYHLRVSVGLHEGTSLDGAEKHFDALRDIMGPEHVTILGILSDDAVSEELHNADYVLAFFEGGARFNNTTVHAAADAGCRVITNGSPLRQALTIETMVRWPTYTEYGWSWDALLEAMREECEKSKSRIA